MKQETTGETKIIHKLQRRHKPWALFMSPHTWKYTWRSNKSSIYRVCKLHLYFWADKPYPI